MTQTCLIQRFYQGLFVLLFGLLISIPPHLSANNQTMIADLELSGTSMNSDPSVYSFFSISFTIVNKGNTAVDDIVIDIPVPDGAVLEGGDPYNASQGQYQTWLPNLWTVGSLAPNASADITLNYFNLSEDTKAFYAQVLQQSPLDADSNPNNGTPPNPVEDDEAVVAINGGIFNALPDLIITELTIPASTPLGAFLDLSGTIQNQGNAPAENFNVHYYISKDAVLSNDDIAMGSDYISMLDGGATETLSGPSTNQIISYSSFTGPVYLIAIVDEQENVMESNEGNNLYVQPFTIEVYDVPAECITWDLPLDKEVLCSEANAFGGFDVYYRSTSSITNQSFLDKQILDADGNQIDLNFVGTHAIDSFFVEGDQVIKKQYNGQVVWQKTIPADLFDDFPTITHATELTDGSIILGGIEKWFSPSIPPFDRDSCYLIKLDADMNFVDYTILFEKLGTSPSYIETDALELLYARPDGSLDVFYSIGVPVGLTPGVPSLVMKQLNSNLEEVQFLSGLNNRGTAEILHTPCGQYRIKGSTGNFSIQSFFLGSQTLWIDPIDYKIEKRMVIGNGSVDFFGPYNSYQFTDYTGPEQMSVGFSGVQIWNVLENMSVSFGSSNPITEVPIPFFQFDYAINLGNNRALIFDEGDGFINTTTSDCIELAPCNISVSTSNLQCNDNNTPDPNDDTWSFDLLVSNSGAGNNWSGSGFSGAYNTPVTIDGLNLNLNPDFELNIRDAVYINCTASVNVTAPTDCQSPPPNVCTNNLLSNAGFESGSLSPWGVLGEATITNDASEGNFAARIIGGESRVFQALPAQAGETYNLEVFAKTSAAGNSGANVYLKFLSASWQPLSYSDWVSIDNDGTYQPYSLSATAPPNTAYVEVNAQKNLNAPQLWVDDWCLSTGTVDPCAPDITPPNITFCPPELILMASQGAAQGFWPIPEATDLCGEVNFTNNFDPGATFFPGLTVVEYIFSDDAGNTATCSFEVLVIEDNPCNNDTEAPVFTNCPTDYTFETDQQSVIFLFPTFAELATDNCDENLDYTFSHVDGDELPIGTTTITVTARDDAGNIGSCIFTVTVISVTPNTCTNNLLANADFEANNPLQSWITVEGATTTSDDAYSGNNALLMNGFGAARIVQSFPAQAGLEYTFSGWGKLEGDNLLDAFILVKFLTSDFQPLDFARGIGIRGEEYAFYTTTHLAPENTAIVEISIQKEQGYGFVWADDLCVTSGPDNGLCNSAVDPPRLIRCPDNIELFTTGEEAQADWSLSFVSCEPGTTTSSNFTSGDFFPIGTTTVNVVLTNVAGLTTTCSFDVIVEQIDLNNCNNALLQNPDFENNLNGWNVDFGTASPTNDSYSGQTAILLNGQPAASISQVFPAQPLDQFTLSGFAKQSGNVGVSTGIAFIFMDANLQTIEVHRKTYLQVFGTGVVYQGIRLSATAPPNTAFIKIVVQKDQGEANFTVDNFCLNTNSSSTCTSDTSPPVFNNCPSNLSIQTSGTEAVFNYPNGLPLASDNCDLDLDYIYSHLDGELLPLGLTTITATAVDDAGNVGICSFEVAVNEQTTGTCSNNILNNPDYEDNPNFYDGWFSLGGTTMSAEAASGNVAVQVSSQGSENGLLQSVPAEAGESYTVSVQVKETTNLAYLRLKFLSASWQPLFSDFKSLPAIGDYQAISLSGVAPAGTAFVEVGILSNGGAGSFLVDDWCLSVDASNSISSFTRAATPAESAGTSLKSAEVRLFPNPAQDRVDVDLAAFFSKTNVDLKITNTQGTLQYEKRIDLVENERERIDLSGWQNGSYFVWVKAPDGPARVVRMMIIKNY